MVGFYGNGFALAQSGRRISHLEQPATKIPDPDALTLAHAIHVLAIVHWIGGVCAVTTIVLPQARRLADADAAAEFFEFFERRFVRCGACSR